MKETPILFSGPMVEAILEDRKTMTRRVMKPQPIAINEPTGDPKTVYTSGFFAGSPTPKYILEKCPYGKPGDRILVRETWDFRPMPHRVCIVGYRADNSTHAVCVPEDSNPTVKKGWRPSIFMPRWASRILLEITAVHVERLQEISAKDCIKEGVRVSGNMDPCDIASSARNEFEDVWDFINGKKHPWASNPWVWAISFKRLEPK